MTRPTSFSQPLPQGFSSIGGDPSLPGGQPTIDCCADDAEQPDRALEGNTFIGGRLDYVTTVLEDGPAWYLRLDEPSGPFADSSGNGVSVTEVGAMTRSVTGPTPVGGDGIGVTANTDALVLGYVATSLTEATIEGWFRLSGSGLMVLEQNRGVGSNGKVIQLAVGPTTFGAAAGQVTAFFNATSFWLGIHTTATINDGDWHHVAATWAGTAGVALSTGQLAIYIDGVLATTAADSGNTGSSGNAPFSGSGQMTLFNQTHGVAQSVDVDADEMAFYETTLGADRIAARFAGGDTGVGWFGGGFEAVDDDDATYKEIEGGNVIRIDLGAPFEIARVRLLIGCETSGSRTYTLKGGNDADFSDATTEATLSFTATGSFTADEVTETWTPTDAFQFWELTGNDETRYVYSFELYEAGASDATAVAAALDDHLTDTTDAHDASAVSIVDTGGYFTGTDVEAALQELGAGSGGSGIYYNVLDYGAVGDNSTDDTSAIQDAVDAADAAGGGTVFFPHGGRIYKITATIVNAGPLMYLGEGGAGLDNPGPQVHMTTSNTTAFRSNGDPAYSTGFRNLVILGPGSASSGSGIYGNNRNIFTHQVRVQGFYNGIRIGPSSFYSKLWQTFVLSNANADVLLESGANNVEFHGCRIDSAVYGIKADGVHGLRFFGGSIEGNTHGIYCTTGNQNILISGVYFESNTTSDIELGVSGTDQAATIEGSLFTTTGTTRSIDANNLDRLTIVGCFWDAANPPSLDIRTQSATTYVQLANNTYSGAGTSFAGPVRDLDPSQSVTPVAVGTATAGTSRYYANASHVHATGAGTPSTQAIGDSASTGTGPAAAMTDHKHAMPSFGSPVAVGAANADGSASTIARSDHVHQGATSGGSTIFIGQETRTSDGSTTTWALDNDFEPDSVQAFNLTTGVALTVTEGTGNSVTVSAAGSAGNTLSFAYAPVVM